MGRGSNCENGQPWRGVSTKNTGTEAKMLVKLDVPGQTRCVQLSLALRKLFLAILAIEQ